MTEATPPLSEPLFYCADLGDGGDIVLTGDEAHHVTVQRLRRGDAIALFDGHGHVARGALEAIGRREVRVRVQERRHVPPPSPRLELYCAVPKGERLSVLLDMATQLGMTRFTPVTWQRSIAEPRAAALERWRRVCLEACKQSRRLHMPEIGSLTAAVEAAAQAQCTGAFLLLAHPTMQAQSISAIELSRADHVALFVGPEGGVTNEEVERLRALGARLVHLGDGILRIETAAVAMLTLAAHPPKAN